LIILQEEYYSVKQCKENPNNLYVFGDNSERWGKGGQAQIRDEKNTFGIATKWKPTMDPDAFLSDGESSFNLVREDILKLLSLYQLGTYENIIFPKDGFGTGLAMLSDVAPRIYEFMNEIIKKNFGIEYK